MMEERDLMLGLILFASAIGLYQQLLLNDQVKYLRRLLNECLGIDDPPTPTRDSRDY